jgi:peroxiredoxin
MKKLKVAVFLLCVLATNAVGQTRPAIDFSLKNIDDKIISLTSFKQQKGIILTFVTNGCPVAELYQKRIAALHKKYANNGFAVVAINPADDFAAMKDTAAARNYPYYFLYDSTQKTALNYRVRANTHTFVLLNSSKGFTVVYEGAIDNDYSGNAVTKKYIENTIDAMVNKKPIVTVKTRVLGCPIKYR